MKVEGMTRGNIWGVEGGKSRGRYTEEETEEEERDHDWGGKRMTRGNLNKRGEGK